MNCRTLPIVVIVNLKVRITGRSSPEKVSSMVCGRGATGTGWETEARDCGLSAGRYLSVCIGNLLEMGL